MRCLKKKAYMIDTIYHEIIPSDDFKRFLRTFNVHPSSGLHHFTQFTQPSVLAYRGTDDNYCITPSSTILPQQKPSAQPGGRCRCNARHVYKRRASLSAAFSSFSSFCKHLGVLVANHTEPVSSDCYLLRSTHTVVSGAIGHDG